MHSQYTYTNTYTYKKAFDLIDPTNLMLVGLGGISPWAIEATPPQPPIDSITINDLFSYFPVTQRMGAVRVPDYTTGAINYNGFYYKLITVNNVADARDNDVRSVYLSTVVSHNLLLQTAFRIVGLFTDIALDTGATTTQQIYTSNEVVSANLIYLQYCRPTYKQVNLTQNIQIIINV